MKAKYVTAGALVVLALLLLAYGVDLFREARAEGLAALAGASTPAPTGTPTPEARHVPIEGVEESPAGDGLDLGADLGSGLGEE